MRRQGSANPHIAELDGLRALAVLPVIAYHFGLDVNGPGGVTVFFALSGYIVTTVLLREHAAAGHVRLGNFYLRRFRRLLPASTLVVVATVLVGWSLGKPTIVREAFASLTYWADIERYTSSFRYGQSNYAPLEHFWSLAVEEQFYLLLPLACLLFLRKSRRPLMVVVAAGLVASTWFAQAGQSDPLRYFHPAARVCELLVGVLLALVGKKLHARWGYVALVGLTLILANVFEPRPIVIAVVTCAVIAGLPRVLALRPLVAIGRYSYGLYLWHPLAAIIAHGWPMRIVLTAAFTVACYHLVEFPIRFTMPARNAITAMAGMSVAGLCVALIPFGNTGPTFIPAAEAVVATPSSTTFPVTAPSVVTSTGPVVTTTPATTLPKRPLRISAAGDSTQMFMDAAWQVYAAANPSDLTWVLPPDDTLIWTSGADAWIREEAPRAHLSLPFDGPQGGLDRQGCPLIYDLLIRPEPGFRFFESAKLHSATPVESCDWHDWIPAALATMHLDVLVVSWGTTSMWQYEMPDGSTSYIGRDDYDSLMAARMIEFEEMAAQYGTTVVWTTYAPKPRADNPDRWTLPETADLLAAVTLQRPCTSDLRTFVRSDPRFDWYQDGYHFTANGAARAVASIAADLRGCTLQSALPH